MAIKTVAVKAVIENIHRNPNLSEATIRNDVILDILKMHTEAEPQHSDSGEEHDPGNPSAFTSGLISGNFPSW